ncbi:MAG: GNAT family N-acetyltransferase [Acidobacteriota bacterium]|nr:GNAT family N-acetyltransferase [Acidobacteriota bacterium]
MLETERLAFRRFNDSDVDAIFAMRSDARFMRFIKPVETRRETIFWMQMVSRHWEPDNFGFWAVLLKETGAVIGWSGTWILQETKEPEIGFAVASDFWGRGFGTEAAGFALKYTFEERDAECAVALTMPKNLASRRIMEKLGMSFEEEKYFNSYRLTLACYGITRNEYARNRKIAPPKIQARRFGETD